MNIYLVEAYADGKIIKTEVAYSRREAFAIANNLLDEDEVEEAEIKLVEEGAKGDEA